ncbi:MAG: G1 family glutamic endopeptidase [Acidimicrobiales bacterium]
MIAASAVSAVLLCSGTVQPALGLVPARHLNAFSGNWAGYVTQASNVTSVTGTWTVPSAGLLPPGVSSTWTGIGGFQSSDLIQAGTVQDSTPLAGSIDGGMYAAWYEILPASPVYITGCIGDPSCTVGPGDQMQVTISSPGGRTWSIHMADSRGWTYDNTTIDYQSTRSSAEWIHEAPTLIAVMLPMGNSGAVTFDGTNTVTTGTNNPVSIGGAAPTAQATDALPVETTTSGLDSDGDGFSVCTYAITCSPPGS